MKKNRFFLFLGIWLLTMGAFGCGWKRQEEAQPGGDDGAGMETEQEATSQLQLGSAVEIPEGFDGQTAEKEADGQLEAVIAEYCSVDEKDYVNVRYDYTYVDLDGNGQDEILAFVLGQDVNGIDGNLLLWADKGDNMTKDAVRQSFRQIGVPVYISNHKTGGYRDLIFTNYENPAGDVAETGGRAAGEVSAENGGRSAQGEEAPLEQTAGLDDTTGDNGAVLISLENTYLLLQWDGDAYQSPDEGTLLYHLDGQEGTAVLTNSMESGPANGSSHFLGEAMP